MKLGDVMDAGVILAADDDAALLVAASGSYFTLYGQTAPGAYIALDAVSTCWGWAGMDAVTLAEATTQAEQWLAECVERVTL